jgi:hypothetical protein
MCEEYALEEIMYDIIPDIFIELLKASLYEYHICIIEYVIRLWSYIFIMF